MPNMRVLRSIVVSSLLVACVAGLGLGDRSIARADDGSRDQLFSAIRERVVARRKNDEFTFRAITQDGSERILMYVSADGAASTRTVNGKTSQFDMYRGAVYSRDAGEAWTRIVIGPPSPEIVQEIAREPKHPSRQIRLPDIEVGGISYERWSWITYFDSRFHHDPSGLIGWVKISCSYARRDDAAVDCTGKNYALHMDRFGDPSIVVKPPPEALHARIVRY